MAYHHHHHARGLHHHRRDLTYGSPSIPAVPTEVFGLPSLLRRTDCTEDDTSAACEKPTADSALPIILGSCIPIVCAVFVLIYLHRRHMQKLKQEDAMDKTKSMDFGLEIGSASGKLPKVHVSDTEKGESRSRRQMSLEMDSPYLMPGAVDSMVSLSRGEDHIYGRPMTGYSGTGSVTRPPHAPTTNSYQRGHARDSSVYTAPRAGDESPDDSRSSMNAELLKDAQNMATSTPPRTESLPRRAVPEITVPSPAARVAPSGLPASPRDGNFVPQKVENGDGPSLASPRLVDGLPLSLQVGTPSPSRATFPDPFLDPANTNSTPKDANTRPLSNDESEYGDGIQFRFSTASAEDNQVQSPEIQVQQPHTPDRKSLAPAAMDGRRLSMGFRPLPPEGNPDDTAEQRALRIRSFYKEYFSVEDDAANAPPMPPLPAMPPMPASNSRPANYGESMYDDTAAIFDPETGRFIMPGTGAKPFAEPPTRRAMTPPPRAPPRFSGNRSRAGSITGGPRFMPPGPRAFSSASGRLPPHMGGPAGRPGPRRPIEPPKPLHVLPTPSKMNEDAFVSPTMFAPPIRVNRDGAESPSNGLRPYSPSVPAHIPLASPFEELSSLPTPHMLQRNSYAFLPLDFAPPKKFKNEGDVSDAGSIRSNQSGMSAMQLHNIRSGAYRVSRLPTEVVPLKDQMAAELRPTWDLRQQ